MFQKNSSIKYDTYFIFAQVAFYSVKISFCGEKLRHEYAASRGAAYCVVGETDKFVVILAVLPQPADSNAHALLKIPIELCLGPVRLIKVF